MLEEKRWRYAVLLAVLLAPSLVFGATYLLNSLPPSNGARHFTLSTGDQGWLVNMTVSHPPYFVTGQQIPVNATLRLRVSSPNITLTVNSITVEYRDPLVVNSTSGVVSRWRILSSALTEIGQNYTASGKLMKLIDVLASYPPSSSFSDPFVASQRVAVNALANVTLNQSEGNTTATTTMILSLLDSQTFYQSQLSTVMSSASWLFYQLLAALIISLAYIKIRPARVADPAYNAYTAKLESYRLERSLAELEGLLRSGKISESRYAELKEGYEKELAKAKSEDVTGGP